jgi:hypothetical protein
VKGVVPVVQAIENLTAVSGRLVATSPHERLKGWVRAVVDVDSTAPVPGKADLLSARVGRRLEVAVREGLIADAAPGSAIRLRAKLAQGEAMAEAHPDAADFAVGPA